MHKKTVFEQVPLELVSKIAHMDLPPRREPAPPPHPRILKRKKELADCVNAPNGNGHLRSKP